MDIISCSRGVQDPFCLAKKKLLISGDVERLSELGLRPLDVGGDEDCFSKAVSHQCLVPGQIATSLCLRCCYSEFEKPTWNNSSKVILQIHHAHA